jgi:Protein of unknown function (DUF2735)
MSASLDHGSAKIYQFPAGGRSALGGRRNGETKTVDQTTPRVNEAACSGSWYHQAAIEDAKPAWDR